MTPRKAGSKRPGEWRLMAGGAFALVWKRADVQPLVDASGWVFAPVDQLQVGADGYAAR